MRKMPLAIWAMVLGAFAMGADEFIVAGVVREIADALGFEDAPAATHPKSARSHTRHSVISLGTSGAEHGWRMPVGALVLSIATIFSLSVLWHPEESPIYYMQ
ncbi:hypothetical protein OHA25_41030 [Nonomuraea sp. NBC_00507]|uniref:hypothetical protein n=1 Tax=Nonomuraea sp. NBC_00507 TaxID=2976002 RepID=UPI002E1869B8